MYIFEIFKKRHLSCQSDFAKSFQLTDSSNSLLSSSCHFKSPTSCDRQGVGLAWVLLLASFASDQSVGSQYSQRRQSARQQRRCWTCEACGRRGVACCSGAGRTASAPRSHLNLWASDGGRDNRFDLRMRCFEVLAAEIDFPLYKQLSGSAHPAFLVQQVKQAQLSLDKTDALLIVTEGDGVPGQLLLDVLLLLQLEHMLEEEANCKTPQCYSYGFKWMFWQESDWDIKKLNKIPWINLLPWRCIKKWLIKK